MTRALAAAGLIALALLAPAPRAAGPTFTDVTSQSGIRFTHVNGAFGKKYLPETLGSGVVVFDADGDGRQDLLFVKSRQWPRQPGAAALPALYRNMGGGRFTDIIAGSGLDVALYGMGGTAA